MSKSTCHSAKYETTPSNNPSQDKQSDTDSQGVSGDFASLRTQCQDSKCFTFMESENECILKE
eukprot:1037072-Amphidinium_carterae.1